MAQQQEAEVREAELAADEADERRAGEAGGQVQGHDTNSPDVVFVIHQERHVKLSPDDFRELRGADVCAAWLYA